MKSTHLLGAETATGVFHDLTPAAAPDRHKSNRVAWRIRQARLRLLKQHRAVRAKLQGTFELYVLETKISQK